MARVALKMLLALYILYALVKFFDFFYKKYETRIQGIATAYENNARAIRLFDDVMLLLMVAFVGLLFATGIEYLSFSTGLLVGMTVIQVYFHRFIDPLPADKAPEAPVSPIKLMSYAIQANPGKAWRELVLMTLLLVWALLMLATHTLGAGA